MSRTFRQKQMFEHFSYQINCWQNNDINKFDSDKDLYCNITFLYDRKERKKSWFDNEKFGFSS